MKIDAKNLGLGALALALLAPAAAAQTKTAIINFQGAIVATKDGQKADAAMRDKFGGRVKDLEALQGDIAKIQDQLNKGSNTMSQEQRDKLARDIDDKKKKLQWDQEDLQNDVDQERGKLINDIGQRMVGIIQEHAQPNGYTLVLDVSAQTSPVIWAANGIDISAEVIALYDKKYGAGTTGPAATPAAPAAKPAAPPAAAPKKPAPPKQ